MWNIKVLHNPVERCPRKEYYYMLEQHMADFLQPSPPALPPLECRCALMKLTWFSHTLLSGMEADADREA